MDENEDFEVGQEVDETDEYISSQWSWFAFALQVVGTVANMFGAVAHGLQQIADLIGRHHNWVVDQREFAEEAREQIEQISARSDGD